MLSATVGLPIFVLDGIATRLNFNCLLRNVHVTAGNSHVVRRAGLVPFGRLVQLTACTLLHTRFEGICSADPRRAPRMRLRTGIKLGAGVSSIPSTWQQGGGFTFGWTFQQQQASFRRTCRPSPPTQATVCLPVAPSLQLAFSWTHLSKALMCVCL